MEVFRNCRNEVILSPKTLMDFELVLLLNVSSKYNVFTAEKNNSYGPFFPKTGLERREGVYSIGMHSTAVITSFKKLPNVNNLTIVSY